MYKFGVGKALDDQLNWSDVKNGYAYLRHNPLPRTRVIPDRERTNCSKCGKPGAWYEFKPGSGECKECQA